MVALLLPHHASKLLLFLALTFRLITPKTSPEPSSDNSISLLLGILSSESCISLALRLRSGCPVVLPSVVCCHTGCPCHTAAEGEHLPGIVTDTSYLSQFSVAVTEFPRPGHSSDSLLEWRSPRPQPCTYSASGEVMKTWQRASHGKAEQGGWLGFPSLRKFLKSPWETHPHGLI